MTPEAFADFLASVPDEPGVYLFKEGESRVLYVGKAVSLRKRLRNYLPGPGAAPKPAFIAGRADSVETIVTRSELEALVLEQTLIQKHRPPYNVIWRDDKSFPLLELTVADDFPRLYLVRRERRKGSRYFGPFTARPARRLQRMVNQFFRVPSCRIELDGKQTPCLYHHLDWCDAPCAGLITRERYAELVAQVRMFLAGKAPALARELRSQMEAASAGEDFEKAAKLRDRLQAIEEAEQDQAAVNADKQDTLALGLARSGGFACLALLQISEGKLIAKRDFTVRGAKAEADQELVASFIGQHLAAGEPPPCIFIPCELDSHETVAKWLAERAGRPVSLVFPKRGWGRELVDIADSNARAALIRRGRVGEQEAREQLASLAQALSLPRIPAYIEGVDLSRLGGNEAVGATIVFRDGLPASSEYRRYIIKMARGDDDLAGMRETISRRLKRLKERKAAFPDLLLLDGGAAHLKAVRPILAEVDAKDVSLAALAKREEDIYLPDRPGPLNLPEDSPALHVLRRVRDEAHRYVNAYQKHRRLMAQRAQAKGIRKGARKTRAESGQGAAV